MAMNGILGKEDGLKKKAAHRFIGTFAARHSWREGEDTRTMPPPCILQLYPPTEQRTTLSAWEEMTAGSILLPWIPSILPWGSPTATALSHHQLQHSLREPSAPQETPQPSALNECEQTQVFLGVYGQLGQVGTSAAEHLHLSCLCRWGLNTAATYRVLMANRMSVPSPPKGQEELPNSPGDTTGGPESHRNPSDIPSTLVGKSSTTRLAPSS